ncbi:hypothetical protein C8J56DRAFT_1162328 [Mycena floridula]|nr:hypothetical protein C8J56DRAFT_1162328 [Mycena floridula]
MESALHRLGWRKGSSSKGPKRNNRTSNGSPADNGFRAAGPSQPTTGAAGTAVPEFNFHLEESQLNVKGDVNSHNIVNQNIVNNITSPRDDHEETLHKIGKLLEPRLSEHARVTRIDKLAVCYKGTRQDILRRIERWISGNEAGENCLCIVGVPGSGKSTIAATIARSLLDAANLPESPLSAEFFIRRGVAETGDQNNIITTIAQQLSQLSPVIATLILKALSARQTLAYPLSNSQIDELLLAPLQMISKTAVIIIDALDELIEPALFSQFIAYIIPKLPSNVRLLLTTRNEHEILAQLDSMITKISLELRVSDSLHDVRWYITEKLGDNLRLRFRDDEQWKNWPTPAQIELLCEHASGLFVWGATAVSHITQCVYDEGLAGRDEVLAEVNSLGMDDLDALYGFILRRLLPKSNPSRKLEYIQQVIGLLVISRVPLNLGTIVHFLGIRPESFDLRHFVQRGQSLLLPGIAQVDDNTIPQMHKSFVDFITSPRAKEFQIHQLYHHGLAVWCALKSMEKLQFNMCNLESSYLRNDEVEDLRQRLAQIPAHIHYSCHHWSQHLCLMGKEQTSILAELKVFMEL